MKERAKEKDKVRRKFSVGEGDDESEIPAIVGEVNLRPLKWALVAALFLSLPALLVLPRGANAGFYILLLCSLIGLACCRNVAQKSFGQLLIQYWPINITMLGLVCAIFLNQLSTGNFVIKSYESPARLALFPVIFWGLLLLPTRALRNFQWGLVAGVMVGATALYFGDAQFRPATILTTPLNPFVDITFITATLVLFSIGWHESTEKWGIVAKLLAGVCGLYASYMSQTRGAWAAVPLFLLLGFTAINTMSKNKKIAVFALVLMLLGGVSISSDVVQSRVASAKSNIQQYFDGGNLDTSVGIRFQLWHGSWTLFRENPLFGVGLEHFPDALRGLEERRLITTEAATQPHSHNELLFHMAALGVFGALAISALYFVPAFYFLRRIHDPDRETRIVAALGLMLTLGFFIVGLTDVMFYWPISYTFYSITLAVLFAHLVKRTASLSRQ